MRNILIMGAGGRDFHNFNVVYRNRRPMPYGDLEAMRLQRFATLADIDLTSGRWLRRCRDVRSARP